MSNKKGLARIALISIVIFILSSVLANAALPEFFGSGLRAINNFFQQGANSPYIKTIDFVFFALLFISIYTMGAVYAFKDFKRAEKTIAILLGIMTAFLFVLGDISILSLLPYVHWMVYFLIFILFYWILKGIKSKFWRFILALLLTLFTIWAVNGLFEGFRAPDVPELAPDIPGFDFSRFDITRAFGLHAFTLVGSLVCILLFIGLFILFFWLLGKAGMQSQLGRFVVALLIALYLAWLLCGYISAVTVPKVEEPEVSIPSPLHAIKKAFEKIKFPTVPRPGLPDITPPRPRAAPEEVLGEEGITIVETPKEGEEKEEEGGKYWWIILSAILLPFAIWGVIWGVKKLRRRPPTPAPTAAAAGVTIPSIMTDVGNVMAKKKTITDEIEQIGNEKAKVLRDLQKIYKRKIRDKSYLPDPDSDEYRNLSQEEKKVVDLLRLEIKLGQDLKELLNEENAILGKIEQWKNEINNMIPDDDQDLQPYKRALNKVLDQLSGIVENKPPHANEAGIKWLIAKLVYMEKSSVQVTRELEQLLDEDNLSQRLSDNWGRLKEAKENIVLSYQRKENRLFTYLKERIKQENMRLDWLVRVLQHVSRSQEEREHSVTRIELVNVEGATELPAEEGVRTFRAQPGSEIKVISKATNGIAPFSFRCYLNTIVIGQVGREGGKQLNENVEFSLGKLREADYYVLIIATGSQEGSQEMAKGRREATARLKIKIRVTGEAPPTPGAPPGAPPERPAPAAAPTEAGILNKLHYLMRTEERVDSHRAVLSSLKETAMQFEQRAEVPPAQDSQDAREWRQVVAILEEAENYWPEDAIVQRQCWTMLYRTGRADLESIRRLEQLRQIDEQLNIIDRALGGGGETPTQTPTGPPAPGTPPRGMFGEDWTNKLERADADAKPKRPESRSATLTAEEISLIREHYRRKGMQFPEPQPASPQEKSQAEWVKGRPKMVI